MPGCRPWHSTAVVQRVAAMRRCRSGVHQQQGRRRRRRSGISISRSCRKGIRDFGADKGYTPLDLVMVACECDLDTAFRFLSERLNWAPDIDLSGLLQPKQPELQAPEPDRQVVEPEQPKAAEPKSKPAVPIDELERFTVVPGAVGDIVDWIVTATSRRPSRIIALGAAITIVGTLIGRRVAGQIPN